MKYEITSSGERKLKELLGKMEDKNGFTTTGLSEREASAYAVLSGIDGEYLDAMIKMDERIASDIKGELRGLFEAGYIRRAK